MADKERATGRRRAEDRRVLVVMRPQVGAELVDRIKLTGGLRIGEPLGELAQVARGRSGFQPKRG